MKTYRVYLYLPAIFLFLALPAVVKGQADLRAAEAKAVELGGHLATVNNLAEHDAIWLTLEDYDIQGYLGTGPDGFWIGLNDLDEEDTFEWADGDTSSYRNWAYGNPDNYSVFSY